MDKNSLVSVIIPVYNSERFLSECLDSVLNQTYNNIEIIVINDGSTDSSLEILQKYSDRIKIVSQKNQGLASALNRGLKEMRGRWFKWFSPDDAMNPDTIEILVKMGENLGENYIIYSNWDMIDEHGNFLRHFSESNYNSLDNLGFNVRLLDGQQINVNTTLIPSSLFSKGLKMNQRIDPVLVDYDFFLRSGLLFHTKFYLIDKFLIKFRVHQSQLSHKHIVASLDGLKTIRKEILDELDEESRNNYSKSLLDYRKEKPFSRKSMEATLFLMSKVLPDVLTDKILVFYLNKIRTGR